MILKTLAIVVTVIVIALSVLWVRSTTRDEGISWASERVTVELTEINREYKVAWGPRGLRFWVWFDSEPVADWAREIAAPKHFSGFHWESAPYKKGMSWGWPEESYWNRHGFWFNTQEYHWDDGHHRWLSLIASPFWLFILIALAGLGAILWKWKRSKSKPALQATAATSRS